MSCRSALTNTHHRAMRNAGDIGDDADDKDYDDGSEEGNDDDEDDDGDGHGGLRNANGNIRHVSTSIAGHAGYAH